MNTRSSPPDGKFRFGPFVVDVPAGELRKAGIKINLHGQPLEVLMALLERPGEVVTREELRERLWPPDVFVDVEVSLNKAVNRLRAALDDTADKPRFVETLPRRGYRFIFPMTSTDGGQRVTWRRKWLLIGSALVLAVVVSGVGLHFYLHRAHPLREGDMILLADIENTTGDAVFDGALKQGLTLQLEQTPFVEVFSEARAREVLPYMRLPSDTRMSPAIAREICVRRGLKAMVTTSIASLGRHYVISLDAVNCKTGDPLGRSQVEADSREHVLAALGLGTSRLRAKMGESLTSIEKFDRPLNYTTNSLEALEVFYRAWHARDREVVGVGLLKRAIELDPDFAMAYAALGTFYNNLGEKVLAVEYTKRAFARKERLGPREKFYIDSHYYGIVTGEFEKEIETYRLWLETFPSAYVPSNNLPSLYNEVGQFEKTLPLSADHQRFYPDEADGFVNAAIALTGLNRYEEAKAKYEQAIEQKLDSRDCHGGLYQIAFLQTDIAAMRRHAAGCDSNADKVSMLEFQAGVAAFLGQLQQAKDHYQEGMEIAQRSQLKELAADLSASEALVEATFGDAKQAQKKAVAALAIAHGPDVRYVAAAALALSGDAVRAKSLCDELGKEFPTDTLLHSLTLPTVYAAIETNRGNPAKALELLRPAAAYELGSNQMTPKIVAFLVIYVRGQAFLRARDGARAAAEYQKILDHRGVDLTSPLYPLAHIGLARAWTLANENAKSKRSYEDFFSVWKNADPEIPILNEAKAEYTRLK